MIVGYPSYDRHDAPDQANRDEIAARIQIEMEKRVSGDVPSRLPEDDPPPKVDQKLIDSFRRKGARHE